MPRNEGVGLIPRIRSDVVEVTVTCSATDGVERSHTYSSTMSVASSPSTRCFVRATN